MDRFLNALLTGGKTLLYAIIGSALSAALIALNNVHLTGLAGIMWTTVGFAMATAFIKTLQRMFTYEPVKDPAVVGPLVPLKAVPIESKGETIANVEAIKDK